MRDPTQLLDASLQWRCSSGLRFLLFLDVLAALTTTCSYIYEAITLPHSFEQLRTVASARALSTLVLHLTNNCHHRAIVHACLALKAHFAALEESSDEPGVNEARGYACEYVAWQFVTNLTERDTIDYLLYEIQPSSNPSSRASDIEREQDEAAPVTESSALLGGGRTSSYFGADVVHDNATSLSKSDEFTAQFENLSALEIAAVSNSKKFLKQRPVQKIINGLWRVCWSTLYIDDMLIVLVGRHCVLGFSRNKLCEEAEAL